MGHNVSREVTPISSNQSTCISTDVSLVSLSEENFEIISNIDLSENMNSKSKIAGKRPMVKTWSSEIQSERQHLEGKHPELKPVLLGFKHCKDTLDNKKKRDEKYFSEIHNLLKEKIVRKFSMAEYSSDEQREVMGNKLAEIGFVETALDYYSFILDDEDIEAVTNPLIRDGKDNDPATKLIMTLREIFWNFSDSSFYFGEKLAETGNSSSDSSEMGIFQLLMVDLDYILRDTVEALEIEEDIFAFSSAVGILHNCARNPDIEKDKFRKVQATEHLLPFLHSRNPYVKMITLLALANMIREDQVTLLDADLDVFDFVFKAISETWKDKSDRTKGYGFSLAELIDGLASLAQTEQNKKLIMEKEPIQLTCTITRDSDVDIEKLAAVRFIWELAFLEENKKKIVKYTEMKKVLGDLKEHSDPDIKKTASGAYFVLYEIDKILNEPKPAKKGLERRISGVPKKEGKHIMISYQWADQPMVTRIYDTLKDEGYEVWIDREHMSGYENLLEGMANAVENAYLVLICFSEKYKLSQNCRTEAEMVFTTQKDFIALKMQRDYKPDGWLLALIGARLFIEFSHKHPFEESIVKLLKQISDRHIEPDDQSRDDMWTPAPTSEPAVYTEPALMLNEWTKKEVDAWMVQNKMTHKSFVKVKTLTGLQISFLIKVYKRAPDTFFRWVEEKLLLKELEEIRIFTVAIEDLAK